MALSLSLSLPFRWSIVFFPKGRSPHVLSESRLSMLASLFHLFLHRNFCGLLFPSFTRSASDPPVFSVYTAVAAYSTSALTDDVQMQLYLRKFLGSGFHFLAFLCVHSLRFLHDSPKISQLLLTAQFRHHLASFFPPSLSLVQPKQLTLCPIRM